MRADLALYSIADPVFFDSPTRWDPVSTRFATSVAGPPVGWESVIDDVWENWRPLGGQLPEQGWKIHVAATPDTAEETLRRVAGYCTAEGVWFKFLWSRRIVQAFTGKYAPRSGAGKVVTIFPADDEGLARHLPALDGLVGGRAGAHVLTDLRWGAGPVSVRWGGFRRQWCLESGRHVLAVRTPDGSLVADDRRPAFRVPPWVTPPAVLDRALESRRGVAGDLGATITESLHFSAGGGVYRGHTSDGTSVIVKEARTHAAVEDGADAVARLRTEEWALRRLDGVRGVPRVRDVRQVWEHHFLITDDMGGRTLQSWSAHHFPLVHWRDDPAALADYHRRADAMHDRVAALLNEIHRHGIGSGDLHAANVLVIPPDPSQPDDDGDGEVALVDFEVAFDVSDRDHRAPIGNAGFVSRTRRGAAADHYALAVMRLWLHLPLGGVLGLAPAKLSVLADEVDRLYGLDGEMARHVREHLPVAAETAAGPARLRNPSPAPPRCAEGPDPRRAALRDGLWAMATPERSDRLFPGDVTGLPDGGDGLGYGAAGVLWALHHACDERVPAWEDWLCRAASAAPRRAGLMVGSYGVAHVLAELGRLEEADGLARRSRPLLEEPMPVGLAEGSAGVGLACLSLWRATGDATYRDQALHLGTRVTAALTDGGDHGIARDPRVAGARDAGSRAGLWFGWSGVALFLLRLHQTGGDPAHLASAVTAVMRDLDHCVESEPGVLSVDAGFRVLPYLEVGSAGIGVVADLLDRHGLGPHDPEGRIGAALPLVARAARSPFVAEGGVASGRAGLMFAARRLDRHLVDRSVDAVGEHRSHLDWHLLEVDDGLAVVGLGGGRLSADLATGTAGVLAALAAVDGVVPAPLPFLETAADPAALTLDRSEGGDHVRSRPAAAGGLGFRDPGAGQHRQQQLPLTPAPAAP